MQDKKEQSGLGVSLSLGPRMWLEATALMGLFLAFALLLAWGASGLGMIRNAREPGFILFAGSGLALWCLTAGLLGSVMRGWMGRLTDRSFLGLLFAVSLAIKFGVLAAGCRYVEIGDGVFFRDFVVQLHAHGLNRETLLNLNGLYDFRVWLSRSFPFYYPIRAFFGAHDLLAVRVFNVLLSSGTVVLTCLLGRLFFRPVVYRTAGILMLVFPLHNFDVLNYAVQIPGTFLFLLTLYLIMKTLLPAGRWMVWTVGDGIGLGILLWVLRVQRGLDVMVIPVLALCGLFYLLSRQAGRFRRLLLMSACAMAVYMPLSALHEHWVDRYDMQHLRSHALGFMSRGWNPMTMGEYLETYEQLDVATPIEEKKRTLVGIMVSQGVGRPLFTLGLLPWVKAAKFFLVGYASGMEQGFERASHPGMGTVSRGLRVFFAPFFLLMALLGCMRYLRSQRWSVLSVFLIALPVMSCVAAVVLWETSPRYSHPVHFALALLAGMVVTKYPWRKSETVPACPSGSWHPVRSLALVFGGYVVIACLAYSAAYALAPTLGFQDLRKVDVDRARFVGFVVTPERITHLEQWVLPLTATNDIRIPIIVRCDHRPEGHKVSFYLALKTDGGTSLGNHHGAILIDGKREAEYDGNELASWRRFEGKGVSDKNGLLRLELRASVGREGEGEAPHWRLQWGYFRVD